MAQPTYNALYKVYSALSSGSLGVNVYNHHKVADLDLNAVTVGVVSTGLATLSDSGQTSNTYIKNHTIRISIYGHTAWMEQDINHNTTIQLMDDIMTVLIENQDLGDQYHISGFSSPTYDETFTETDTQGGRVDIEVHVVVGYTRA